MSLILRPAAPRILGLFALALGGCAAEGDGWPRLASEPPAAPVALLPSVEIPAPPEEAVAMDADVARSFAAGLLPGVKVLEERLAILRRDLDADLSRSGNDRGVPGSALRATEMTRSRLGMLESEIGILLREAGRSSLAASSERTEAMLRLQRLATEVSALLGSGSFALSRPAGPGY